MLSAWPWALLSHLPFPGHPGTGKAWMLSRATGCHWGRMLKIYPPLQCLQPGHFSYFLTSASKAFKSTSLSN